MLLSEMRSLFRRTRVRVLLILVFLIPVLLAVAVKVHGGPSDGQGPAFLNRVTQNGVFDALAGLVLSLPIFLPLTVAIVAGDTVSGEASLGTLRYLLTRPAGRSRFLLVKAASVVAYCLAASLAVVAGGLIAGSILFPVGHVLTLSGTEISLTAGILRCLLAGLVVAGSLLGLAAIGMFVSTLTDTPVAAIGVTVGAVIVSNILDAVPQVSFAHPWLFTHRWLDFGDLFRSPVSWNGMVRDLLLQAAYVAVFGLAAWARFTTRDVLA